MDDFIKFLLVTGQIDEVFFGKKKEEETMTLKRTLDKERDNKKDNSDK